MRAHRDLAAELAGGSAEDAPWYHHCGTLEWADTGAGSAALRSRVCRLREWDYPALVRPVGTAQVCVRPLPVDGQSIVGPAPGIAGCYLLVTHSGVTLASHLARLVAGELMDGVETRELARFRPDRFSRSGA